MTSQRLLMLCERVISVPATLSETTSRSDPILVAVPRRTDSDLSGFNARQLWSNHSWIAMVQAVMVVDANVAVALSMAMYN